YILSAATFTHGWHPETINSIVPGSWSIAVEFTFYLTLPFLFKLINNKEKGILFLIFTLIINYFINGWIYQYWAGFYPKEQLYLVWGISYYGFFNQLPVFASGIVLFHFFKGHTFNNQKLTSLLYILLSVFLMIAADNWVYQKYTGKIVIYAVAFAFLIYALANNSFSFFVNPVTKFTGKLSYSMYFIHFAVLNYFVRYDFFGLSGFKTFGTFIALLIVFISTMIIAVITYNLVEKKGIALGRYVIKKIDSGGASENLK
ncbi:MAG: acyltransferase, partial [Chlorobi bacterium]|nr:acyltransferase [Chlorobiota bacterium]